MVATTDVTGPRTGFWKSEYGLRSGWAFLLYILLSTLVTVVLLAGAYFLAHWRPDVANMHSKLNPGPLLVQTGAVSCGLLFAYFVVCRLGAGGWRDFGLNPARMWRYLGQGAVVGSLMMSLLVGILVLTHALKLSYSGSAAGAVISSGLQWAAIFFFAAFCEEMEFRGYPFLRLSLIRPPLVSAIIMSVTFGLVHLGNGGEGLLGISQAAAIGLVYCLAVWRTGSLWWATGAHAAWNWTQTFVFGCSNSGLSASASFLVATPAGAAWLSGGATGPEGSAVCIPIVALTALIIVLTLPQSSRNPIKVALPATASEEEAPVVSAPGG